MIEPFFPRCRGQGIIAARMNRRRFLSSGLRAFGIPVSRIKDQVFQTGRIWCRIDECFGKVRPARPNPVHGCLRNGRPIIAAGLKKFMLTNMRFSIFCALGLSAVLLGHSALAQTAQPIYADALVSGWQNWSWATVNLSAPSPVHSGTRSVSVTADAWEAIYLHHDAFDSSGYTDLVFWIHGGSTGGQLLQVQAELN